MRLSAIPATVLMLLVAAGAVLGDKLFLWNGEVHEGRLVSEDEHAVRFEVERHGIAAVLEFKRSEVVRVVKEEAPAPPPVSLEPPAAATRQDGGESAPVRPQVESGAGPVAAQADEPSDEELIETMMAFLAPACPPLGPPPTTAPDQPPLVGAEEQEMFRQFYGDRVRAATASGDASLQGKLAIELFQAARTAGQRPGLARLMLRSAMALHGQAVTARAEQRRLFVALLDRNNLNHLAGLLDWDITAWKLARQEAARRAPSGVPPAADLTTVTHLAQIAAGASDLARWYLLRNRAEEARAMLADVAERTDNAVSGSLRVELLAARGAELLSGRIAALQAELEAQPDNPLLNRGMALTWLCYGDDPAKAQRWLARMDGAGPFAALKKAAGQSDPRQANLLLADGLYALFKASAAGGEADRLPADVPASGHLARAAARYYLRYLAATGPREDALVARLKLNELEVLRRDRGGTVLFGIPGGSEAERLVVALDVSAAMSGVLAAAQREIVAAIDHLFPAARFTVLAFDQAVLTELAVEQRRQFHPASAPAKQWAREFVNGLAVKRTSPRGDLRRALEGAFRVWGGPPDVIFLVTASPAAPDAVEYLHAARRDRPTRVHVVLLRGLGAEAERRLADAVHSTGGTYRLISEQELAGH